MDDKKIILCWEVDKNSGSVAVYPIKVEVTDIVLIKLSIRSRMNPELEYYVMLAEKWDNRADEIRKLLYRRTVNWKAVKHYADIVKI